MYQMEHTEEDLDVSDTCVRNFLLSRVKSKRPRPQYTAAVADPGAPLTTAQNQVVLYTSII